jgi:hypothetical protein
MHCIKELDGESSDAMDIDGLSEDASSLQQQQQQQQSERTLKAETSAIAAGGGAELAVLREDPVEEADMGIQAVDK